MAIQVPTSPNICFYTTWGKQNKRNMHWNAVSKMGMTDLIFVDPGAKVNGRYYHETLPMFWGCCVWIPNYNGVAVCDTVTVLLGDSIVSIWKDSCFVFRAQKNCILQLHKFLFTTAHFFTTAQSVHNCTLKKPGLGQSVTMLLLSFDKIQLCANVCHTNRLQLAPLYTVYIKN